MPELPRAVWRRSARCVSDHHCVEIADLGDAVGLRNSQRSELSLTFSKQVWRGFVDRVKAGDFHSVQD
ncbi:DUF397 domain-containing protein [Actinoplanes sp. ATCC 53533]|uniref:DUF397 domain-containing protein n=1 Tax=Actinoplanes sp. ATCC 53533 TaxID=1288362 RepID=UPI000F77C407|nr:DUF397 domain-containing protein [Actinoplanes sp. ATCC 53533]RSM51518.1 DUF397 domain-containing protein [Actinoplanes sp. ATCC 53533]